MGSIKYLDSNGLSYLWNKIKESITNTETQIFDSVDKNIEDVAFVVANAIYILKNSIGTDDNLKVHFEWTQHFQDCNSIMDAIYKIDNSFITKDELYAILGTLFSGMNYGSYGSGGDSGEPIGDFEVVEEELIESVEEENVELT